MTAKKKTTKTKRPAAAPPPPPPVAPTPVVEGCAVEKLNSRLNALGQARDALIGVELLEDMSGERHGTQKEARQKIETRVQDLARAIASDWTAHE